MEIGGIGIFLDFIISDDENQEPPRNWKVLVKANHVPVFVRYDEENHWPVQIDGTTQRCKQRGCSPRGR